MLPGLLPIIHATLRLLPFLSAGILFLPRLTISSWTLYLRWYWYPLYQMYCSKVQICLTTFRSSYWLKYSPEFTLNWHSFSQLWLYCISSFWNFVQLLIRTLSFCCSPTPPECFATVLVILSPKETIINLRIMMVIHNLCIPNSGISQKKTQSAGVLFYQWKIINLKILIKLTLEGSPAFAWYKN